MRHIILMALLIATLSFAIPRDPVGERAYYKIDTKGGRTTGMVTGGDIDSKVLSLIPDVDGKGPAYEVNLDYRMNVVLVGTRRGSKTIALDPAYFDPDFMVDLRKNKTYKGKNFTVDHLGYKDAKTMDKKSYPNCDYLHFYDISTPTGPIVFTSILRPLLDSLNISTYDDVIEDMEIWALVHPSIPVLGGAKIDLKGIYQGSRIKAGADYIAGK